MIDNALRKDASFFRFLQATLVHRLLTGILYPWPCASCQCQSAIMVRLNSRTSKRKTIPRSSTNSRIQAVASNTSSLQKNTPRLLF